MTVLIAVLLTVVAVVGLAVVLSSNTAGQAVTLSVYGLTLSMLFMALQAPDVALSQVAVGSAVVPLMVLLTIRQISKRRNR